MDNKLFLHLENIQQVSIESTPEEDMGMDYDEYDDNIILGDTLYADAGLVKIDTLIEALVEMKSNSVNYVACDWHCDHQELDLYGVKFRVATPEEKQLHVDKINKKLGEDKQRQIKSLEEKLKMLKSE